MSVLYGLLYMLFVAYPMVYQQGKGYSAGITGIMFTPIAIGVIISAMCVNKHYLKLAARYDGPPHPNDDVLQGNSNWFVHICMDFISKDFLGWAVSRWIPCRRIYLPLHLQFGK